MICWVEMVLVSIAVLFASAGGAYLYSKHHMRSLLQTAQTTALAEGNLIRVALEHQMIENDRTLIAAMIGSFRKQERVERLVLLDRFGKEQYPQGTKDAACAGAEEPGDEDSVRSAACDPLRKRR